MDWCENVQIKELDHNHDFEHNDSLSIEEEFDMYHEVIFDDLSCAIAAGGAIFCGLLGTVGNVLTITVLSVKKSLRSHTTTPFMMSLALSDLLFCAFCLPLTAVRFIEKAWIFEQCTCQLFPFIFFANIFISALSMAFVALNRLVGVYFPGKMDMFFSYKKSLAFVAFIWILSYGAMALPLTRTWGHLGYDPEIFSCTILPDSKGRNPMKTNMIIGFLLPSIIMVVSYALIYKRIRSLGNQMRQAFDVSTDTGLDANNVNNVSWQLRKREKNITKTGLLVCASYIVCFMPSALMLAFHPMPPNNDLPGLHVAGYIIYWCSGFVNPVIYVVSNKYYRQAMFDTFCRKRNQGGSPVMSVTDNPYRFTIGRSKKRALKRLKFVSETQTNSQCHCQNNIPLPKL